MAMRDLKEIQKRADALTPEEQLQLADYLVAKARRSMSPNPFDKEKWAEAIKGIESFRGKLPVLPDSAFSTDELYD
jgi:hypothetical protein